MIFTKHYNGLQIAIEPDKSFSLGNKSMLVRQQKESLAKTK
jgi:hypothetical protein